MPYGLPSTQEQLAAFRDESDTGVALVHVDTCLGCYLQDHHNRDGECLFGVYVDGTTTNAEVHTGLLDEFRTTGDRVAEEDVSSATFVKLLDEWFAGREPTAPFDSRLEVPEVDEDGERIDDDMGESCQAWFVLTWTHKPYVAWDIHTPAGHLVHNVIVTDEERSTHLAGYDKAGLVWTETGRYSQDEADDMSYTDRGLAHLETAD